MKPLSQHITESFVTESADSKIALLRGAFVEATKMSAGNKIRAIKKIEDDYTEYARSMSDNQLIDAQIKTSHPLEQKIFGSLLHARAQDKLNAIANKNRQGSVGKVTTIKHAIEILQDSVLENEE